MIRLLLAVSALALLTACGDGQPLFDEDPATDDGTGTDGDGTDGGGIDGDGAEPPLPGTAVPQADAGILRFEAATEGSSGGLVESVAYNRANDTFTVDGIGFDGDNVYTRLDGPNGTLNRTRVFAAASSVRDPLTGTPVDQVTDYRALYGVSKNRVDGDPRTSYAIVRTGGYTGYGFGGFLYERKGGVVLPDSGQATYAGEYAGVRVFENRSGIEYTTGDMDIAIDFDDFNANDAVKGRLTNRAARTESGELIATDGANDLKLPSVNLAIQQGGSTLDSNGEIKGTMISTLVDESGALQTYETGTFNGILAGDATTLPGGEIVGVIVLQSADPRFEGVNVQETGGVILYR